MAEQIELTAAARDVLAERERQRSVEGWLPYHDDKHVNGELANAAAAYALVSAMPSRTRRLVTGIYSLNNISMLADIWPFSKSWWKPKDPRRDLVRAGALILAEIERRDRVEAANG